jgi:tetratricopeptide (TPR) repeat protein
MRQLLIVIAILVMLVPVASLGDDFNESQLNRGIRNSDAYAFLLMRQADNNSTDAVKLLNQALSYSPDLPAVHFALARKGFTFSGSGVLQSIDHLVEGFNAYTRNFWWSFTLSGAFFFSLVFSFVLAYAVVIAVRLPLDIPLITHDLNESPARVFSLIMLVLLSVLSPLCLIAGVLVLIGIYMSRTDRNAVYGFLLFLLFLPVFLSAASVYVSAPSSGAMKAVVQTNELKGNEYAISNLGNSTQDKERFSYALALKREGFFRKAIAVYTQLAEKAPDARVLVNLGNCYVGLYNFQEENKGSLGEALKYYDRAVAIKPLASAYYNLSQISRELLEFEKGDEYFKAALNSDRTAVTRYSAVSVRQANRFVADETLPGAELWGYARANSKKVFTFGLTILPPATISLIAVVLLVVFVLLPGRLSHAAYRCRKCSTILCNRCERELVVGQICSQCYGSLLKLAELDVKERVARILSIYDQQKRRRDIMKILSFVLPGSAHIYAGKILLGLLMLWPFLFCAVFPFISAFCYPGSSLISHGIVSLAMITLAVIIYGISNIFTRRGISKGWL